MDSFKALTYPRIDLKDYTLDENFPASQPTQHTRYASQTDLGLLEQLPLELLQASLFQLDLHSLINFRMVSRRGCLTVDSIPQFSSITKHAQIAVRAALAIQTAPCITCKQLDDTLCTTKCETCGDFGGYIYMLTCVRVCFLCISNDKRYLPYDLTMRRFKTLRDALCDLPHMKSIPGRYSPLIRNCPRRLRLWDRESAKCSAISMEQVERAEANTFDVKSGNKLRFMAIFEVPVLDPGTGASEWGVHCLGRKDSHTHRSQHFRRKFNERSFQAHIEKSGPLVDDGNHIGDKSYDVFLAWFAAELPPLPQGQWSCTHISSHLVTETPCFSCSEDVPLPGITHLWHPLSIDYVDLNLGRKLKARVQEATCRYFEGKIVVKLARFPREIPLLEQETQAYSWIKNTNIGPTFLAHLTEEGRTIGSVMEHIAYAHHPEPEEIFFCQEAMERLHKLGVQHGDANKYNILIREECVTLVDFACATQCHGPGILDAELDSLESELHEPSGRGRPMGQ